MLKQFEKLNEKIAVMITTAISTMWCVYVFCALVAIPLIFPATSTTIMYISSSFLQLIFLPIIMVGQEVLSRKSEQRAQQDHETLLKQFDEIKTMHAEVHAMVSRMNQHEFFSPSELAQSEPVTLAPPTRS